MWNICISIGVIILVVFIIFIFEVIIIDIILFEVLLEDGVFKFFESCLWDFVYWFKEFLDDFGFLVIINYIVIGIFFWLLLCFIFFVSICVLIVKFLCKGKIIIDGV